ncbi:MAG: putative RND superfamily exporter protein [Cyclobacteriaceae bacterium]|jgi:predicted RND superfamily exporter protein
MWSKLSQFILKSRLLLLLILAVITAFMGYHAQFVKSSFNLANIVPDDDPEMIHFKEFKRMFGEDGNTMAIGLKDSSIYEKENFRKLSYLTSELEKISGVSHVMGLTNLEMLIKSTIKKNGVNEKGFKLEKIFKDHPETNAELDSLLQEALKLRVYSGLLINAKNGANMILVSIDKSVMNSKIRNDVISDILLATDAFQKDTKIVLHHAGLPYVRYTNTVKIKSELEFFLMLSLIVTGLILFLFFRSWQAVLFPLIIIGIVVVWVMGMLSLFGYEITILTALIPPIIVVIGIPNSVYMLNKYHQEYTTHGDKKKALGSIIKRIGIVTLITNFTTAVGFLVLGFTDIVILREFGIVAGLNIFSTFMVSIIMIPVVFSYLPAPSSKHTKHLQFKPLDKVLTTFDLVVHRHKYIIFFTAAVISAISMVGVSKIEAVSFMVDDLPEDSPLKQDLYFFEEHFSGVMPLEIIIDTGTKKGVRNLKNLRKINELELFLDSLDYISQPISVVSFIKGTRQAYYNNNPKFFDLPDRRDMAFVFKYLSEESDESGIANSFVDSTGQIVRVSLKIADIGSKKMDSLVNDIIKPRVHEIFKDSKLEAQVTGTTLLFIKGNKFLIDNLLTSMAIAFFIIAIIMAVLFRNFKMIIISLIPNIIPLLITGGLMGFAGIPLKPSTALIFSIAFGISVDDSIHFLAKYRQELYLNKFFVPVAVSKSIRETGASMIYTSIILFFGFVIFVASEFGGTVALGALTSITLLMAMFTNLIVLPALLLRFDTGKRNVQNHPLIETFPEFYSEHEDEEIDLEKIKVNKGEKK